VPPVGISGKGAGAAKGRRASSQAPAPVGTSTSAATSIRNAPGVPAGNTHAASNAQTPPISSITGVKLCRDTAAALGFATGIIEFIMAG
jgi:hypothetical protein